MPDEERASSLSAGSTTSDADADADVAARPAIAASNATGPSRERVRAAIDEASDEVGLEIWYRSCVEPLLPLADADLPSCCGANCEPCNLTLIEVAARARRILGEDLVVTVPPSP